MGTAETGRRNHGRRLLAALVVSAGLHLGVLALLVAPPDRAPTPAPPTIELSLIRPERRVEPRADLPTERPADAERAAVAPISSLSPITARAPIPPAPGRPLLPFSPAPFSPGSATPAVAPTGATGEAASSAAPAARLGDALRAADCDERGRRLNRDGCDERLVGTARASTPIAATAAREVALRGEEAARQPPKSLFETVAVCGNAGGCAPHTGIRFGSVPIASPVIPPSTLRGDDDLLRPKPSP